MEEKIDIEEKMWNVQLKLKIFYTTFLSKLVLYRKCGGISHLETAGWIQSDLTER